MLGELGIAKAHVMGYSLGAGVALQTAIRHPELVNKLIVISIAFKADGGDYPEVRAAFQSMPENAPMIGQAIAASPLATMYPDVNWETMMRKSGEIEIAQPRLVSRFPSIGSPTLIMFADADSIMLEHITAFYKLLGGGQRAAGMDGSGPVTQSARHHSQPNALQPPAPPRPSRNSPWCSLPRSRTESELTHTSSVARRGALTCGRMLEGLSGGYPGRSPGLPDDDVNHQPQEHESGGDQVQQREIASVVQEYSQEERD